MVKEKAPVPAASDTVEARKAAAAQWSPTGASQVSVYLAQAVLLDWPVQSHAAPLQQQPPQGC